MEGIKHSAQPGASPEFLDERFMNSRIIFHYPKPIIGDGMSGTSVRPGMMLAAFRNLGYNVDVIGGYRHEREYVINCVLKNVASGVHYAFAYAEATTSPTVTVERGNCRKGINSRIQFL